MVVGVRTNIEVVEEKTKLGGGPLEHEISRYFVPPKKSLESATVQRSSEKRCLVREQEP